MYLYLHVGENDAGSLTGAKMVSHVLAVVRSVIAITHSLTSFTITVLRSGTEFQSDKLKFLGEPIKITLKRNKIFGG